MRSLIVAPAWVGDMVMAHTLVQVLEQRHPGIEIHVVAPRATAPLAGRMPGVAAVHELAVGHGELGLGRRRRLALALRGRGFQTAYVLPNSFKSALIPWWAKIPKRVGWHGEARYGLLNDRRRLDPSRYPRMIDRFMRLGLPRDAVLPDRAGGDVGVDPDPEPSREAAPTPPNPMPPMPSWSGAIQKVKLMQHPTPRLSVDEENRARLLNGLGLRRDGPVTALCPGAEYGTAKQWPPEHFAAVARARLRLGGTVWLMGSAADAETAHQVAGAAPGVANLAGRTSLLDAVDLLSLADTVVTNDSGLMHVACALNRKVVALFGSSSPEFTPPLSPLATIIEKDLDCRPCFQRECPLSHRNCLRGIAPERVIAALQANRQISAPPN